MELGLVLVLELVRSYAFMIVVLSVVVIVVTGVCGVVLVVSRGK